DLELPNFVVESLSRLASALAVAKRSETASRLLGSAEALRAEMGGSHSWVARTNEETLTMLRSQLDEASLVDALEQGRNLAPEDAVALALSAMPAAAPSAYPRRRGRSSRPGQPRSGTPARRWGASTARRSDGG